MIKLSDILNCIVNRTSFAQKVLIYNKDDECIYNGTASSVPFMVFKKAYVTSFKMGEMGTYDIHIIYKEQ